MSAEHSAEKDVGTTWCYRITREQIDGEDFYTIREVYTAPDGSLSWTEDPIAARGDGWIECADDLSRMSHAVGGPVLDLTVDPPRLVSPRTLPRRVTPPVVGAR